MHRAALLTLVFAGAIGVAAPALAQRLPFERTFDVASASTLDVSTIRGKIDVTVGEPGRIIVAGDVTIRVGWNVPANAPDLARQVADQPPVERSGTTIRLRPPSDAAARRAVTVSYKVTVPPDTTVQTVSESGATTVRGVSGPVTVRTQSGAIELNRLGGTVGVTTGSGSVTVDGAADALTVTTSSSAFVGRDLAGSVRVRTTSGAVYATLAGTGDVDVETGSSVIQLDGVRGALTASTRSGRVTIHGSPSRPWQISTGSGSVAMTVDAGTGLGVDAISRSGSVHVDGQPVTGTTSKRTVTGRIRGGGPLIRVSSRSGSIGITVEG